MTRIRFNNGFSPMNNMYNLNSVDRFMNALVRENFEDETGDFEPPVNIIEKEKAFTIQLAIPGLKKEDLSISVENGVLTIAKEGDKQDKNDTRYIRKEIASGRFIRKFRLSRWVDQEKIVATMDNGILELEIAKKEEAIAKPSRQIEIA